MSENNNEAWLLQFDVLMAQYHEAVWNGAQEETRMDYDMAGVDTAKAIRLYLHNRIASQQSEIDRLTRELAEAKLSMRQFAGAVIASSQPGSGGEPIGEIIYTNLFPAVAVSKGYRTFVWLVFGDEQDKIPHGTKLYTRPQPAAVVLPEEATDAWAFEHCGSYEYGSTHAESYKDGANRMLYVVRSLNPTATPITAQRLAELERIAEAAKPIVKAMRFWLEENLCECESGHICGKTERESELKALECALSAQEVKS